MVKKITPYGCFAEMFKKNSRVLSGSCWIENDP